MERVRKEVGQRSERCFGKILVQQEAHGGVRRPEP
jgi:hypothetical protein